MVLLLLSGPLAVGKSSIAKELVENHQFSTIQTGRFLLARVQELNGGASRADLQALGDSLDTETDYRWVVAVAQLAMARSPIVDRWLFDSVRKKRQIDHFRSQYGDKVHHVHLTAPDEVLQKRYEARLTGGGEYSGNTPYVMAIRHPNEIAARQLQKVADYVIDLSRIDAQAGVQRLIEGLVERIQ